MSLQSLPDTCVHQLLSLLYVGDIASFRLTGSPQHRIAAELPELQSRMPHFEDAARTIAREPVQLRSEDRLRVVVEGDLPKDLYLASEGMGTAFKKFFIGFKLFILIA